ncbi:MAG: hypothetical protein DRJ03_17340 [Chloroflexi bacterium]|nr:MAG: hypothetical protein DRJ03_17340 [Chloroflexota bacterium]
MTDWADIIFITLFVVLIGLLVAGVAVMVWVEVQGPEYVSLDEIASNPAKWLGKKITTDGTLKWVDPAIAEDTFIIFIPIYTGEGIIVVPVPITEKYHVYTLVGSNSTVLIASEESLDAYLDQRVRVVGTVERMDVRKDGRVGRGYFIKVEKVERL